MKRPIIDGEHHLSGIRAEMVIAEAVKTMSNDMLAGLFVDAVERAHKTANSGSLKVAIFTGREMKRRGCAEESFLKHLDLMERAIAEAEKRTGVKLF